MQDLIRRYRLSASLVFAILAMISACSASETPARNGSLNVTVVGLPPGVDADVTVTGPGGFDVRITGSVTLTDLTTGSYTVHAGDISTSTLTYTPTEANQDAAVDSSATATVRYEPQEPNSATTDGDPGVEPDRPSEPGRGDLEIRFAGLPQGTAARITITSDGYMANLALATDSFTLRDLPPGTYTVTVHEVTSAGETYEPTQETHEVTIEPGGTTTLTITYSPATDSVPEPDPAPSPEPDPKPSPEPGPAPESGFGHLEIVVKGLPRNVAARVTVSSVGQGGYNYQANLAFSGTSLTLPNLRSGDYTVTAHEVDASGRTYDAQPRRQTVTVEAGGTTKVTIEYASPMHIEVQDGGRLATANPRLRLVGR